MSNVRMRAQLDTDDAMITREIERLQPDIEQLRREIADVDADVAAAMALSPHQFSAHDAAGLQRLAETKRDTLKVLTVDRVAALEARRATPAQKAEAETHARKQIARVEDIATLFDAKFAELTTALDAAKVIARDVATLRAAGRKVRGEVVDVVARHGLPVAVPDDVDASDGDQHIAGLLVNFVEVAISGTPDDRIEMELSHAKRDAVAS